MGDRANVVVIDSYPQDAHPKEAVFLYTHWAGYELPETLRSALLYGKSRWDDAPYLSRIIFQEMIGTSKSQTGYGISSRLTDNEYDLLVVDVARQRIVFFPESTYKDTGFATLSEVAGVPLEEYVGKEQEWPQEPD